MSCPFFTNKFPTEDSLITYINENQTLEIIKNGCSILMFACMNKYQTAALKILEKTPSKIKLSQFKNGTTALIASCKNGLVNVIDKLLDFDPNDILVNYHDENSDNPISIICKSDIINVNDKIDLLEKILDIHFTDLDLSSQNKQGNTPLMLMCSNFELEDIALKTITDYDLDRLNINAVNNKDENAETIAYENAMYPVYQEIIRLKRRFMPDEYEDAYEDEYYSRISQRESHSDVENNDDENDEDEYGATGYMPEIPEFKQQMIDLTKEAYDIIELKNIKIQDYLNENKDNIVIKVEEEYYLSNRDDIARQQNDAIVFECKVANIKKKYNVIANLPLYNLKMIGVDVTPEKVGIIPEYIYYYMKNVNGSNENGIQYILNSNDQLFSVIPLNEKILVSVISANEFNNIGNDLTQASSLHCQAGQGGLTGVIVKAYPAKGKTGGKKINKTKKQKFNKNNNTKNQKFNKKNRTNKKHKINKK